MTTSYTGLELNRQTKNAEETASVLKALLNFLKTEVISREEQMNIFGKGYYYQVTKCYVYDSPSANFFRIS